MLSIKDLEAFMQINEALRDDPAPRSDKSPSNKSPSMGEPTDTAATPANQYEQRARSRYQFCRTLWGIK